MKKHIVIVSVSIFFVVLLLFIPNKEAIPYFTADPEFIDVEITGAVKKPGTYRITQGLPLAYLIDLSGGLLESADISGLNLGHLIHEKTYQIPSYSVHTNEIIHRVNLNTIGYNELMNIPNITENRALEILLYKKEHGTFKRVEDLLDVKGIGVATFDKIKIYFYI